MPPLYLAIRSFEFLLATSLLIQTLEFLRLRSAQQGDALWSWTIQRGDLTHASRPVSNFFDWLFSEPVHRTHLLIRLAAAASLYIGSSIVSATLLFFSTIAILIRWRGAFNGGSDFMTIIALTGLMIAHWGQWLVSPVLAWQAGLGYVCLQTMTSYFISGAIKLFSKEWRNGTALPYFLDGGIYGPLAVDSVFRKRLVAVACSWGFILWECSVPVVFLGPIVAVVYCAIALVFHLLVFAFFGLNRFVWAWVVSFPALIYCATRW
jgi:hypothetical protein